MIVVGGDFGYISSQGGINFNKYIFGGVYAEL